MRRIGVRTLMAAVGLSLLGAYLLAAYLAFRVLVALWLDRPGPLASAAVVVLFALVIGVSSYWFGVARLLASLRAVGLPRELAPEVYGRLDRLCARMGIDPPALLVTRLGAPNAFALGGIGAGDGVVVIDVAVLRLLDGDALEAVLAHELAHLESRDGLVQTLAYTAAQTVVWGVLVVLAPVVILVTGLARASAWIGASPGDWPSNPFGRMHARIGQTVAVLGAVLTLLVFAHSRRREYAADAGPSR